MNWQAWAEEGELTLRCEETGEMIAFPALLESLGCKNAEEALRFIPTENLDRMVLHLERTEPIDAAWTEELDRLRKALKAGAKPELPTGPRYDRMLQYIVYRSIEHAESAGWPEQIEYSTENVDLLLNAVK